MMVFPRRLCVDATSVVSVMRSHRCGRPGGTRAGGRTGGREPVMSNHRCGRPGGARAGRRARTSGRADGWAGGQTADEQAGGGPCPGLAQALPGPCLDPARARARALPEPCPILGPAWTLPGPGPRPSPARSLPGPCPRWAVGGRDGVERPGRRMG